MPNKTEVITLSPAAEARLVFWAAPMDSVHPAAVIADVTGIAANTLQNLRVSGEGPAYIKRGGRIYYRKDALLNWLDQSRTAPAPSPRSAASARAVA